MTRDEREFLHFARPVYYGDAHAREILLRSHERTSAWHATVELIRHPRPPSHVPKVMWRSTLTREQMIRRYYTDAEIALRHALAR